MNSVSAVVSTKTTKQITFEKPEVEDGADMWNMTKDSTLDLNSSYKYVMMCKYFSETCIAAKENEKLGGLDKNIFNKKIRETPSSFLVTTIW